MRVWSSGLRLAQGLAHHAKRVGVSNHLVGHRRSPFRDALLALPREFGPFLERVLDGPKLILWGDIG